MGRKEGKKGFFVLVDKAYAFHVGIHFCVDKYTKEAYLFACFGKVDVSIGYRWKSTPSIYDEDWDYK